MTFNWTAYKNLTIQAEEKITYLKQKREQIWQELVVLDRLERKGHLSSSEPIDTLKKQRDDINEQIVDLKEQLAPIYLIRDLTTLPEERP